MYKGRPDSLLPNVYDPQQLNRYMFERGNPYGNVDKDGHDFGIISGAIMIVFFTSIIVGLVLYYKQGGDYVGRGIDDNLNDAGDEGLYQGVRNQEIADTFLNQDKEETTAADVLAVSDNAMLHKEASTKPRDLKIEIPKEAKVDLKDKSIPDTTISDIDRKNEDLNKEVWSVLEENTKETSAGGQSMWSKYAEIFCSVYGC